MEKGEIDEDLYTFRQSPSGDQRDSKQLGRQRQKIKKYRLRISCHPRLWVDLDWLGQSNRWQGSFWTLEDAYENLCTER